MLRHAPYHLLGQPGAHSEGLASLGQRNSTPAASGEREDLQQAQQGAQALVDVALGQQAAAVPWLQQGPSGPEVWGSGVLGQPLCLACLPLSPADMLCIAWHAACILDAQLAGLMQSPAAALQQLRQCRCMQ